MPADQHPETEPVNRFALDMPGAQVRRLSIGWLLLALGSLVVGGLLTIVIVLSRTPYVQDIFPWVDLFHKALVVHVDLTVLVWFLAMADGGAALAHGVCFAVCVDIGKKRAGTISALMLTMGSLGNVVSALAFGAFVQYTGSWTPPFLVAAAANLAGCLLWLKIDPRKRLV